MSTTPPARLADKQAVAESVCPQCGAKPNSHCLRPDGVRYPRTHGKRIVAYHDKIGAAEFTKRHSTHVLHVRKFSPRFNL